MSLSSPHITDEKLQYKKLQYLRYDHGFENQYLPDIRSLITKDLSEPYSIYVYRYFLCNWPDLCFMALDPVNSSLIGVVVCKLEAHMTRSPSSPASLRGYIAMLAVTATHRGNGIATALVIKAIDAMKCQGAHEVVLETEEANISAICLYQRLGFIRSKKLHRYYLNGNNAYRLILPLQRTRGPGGSEIVPDE